MERQLLWETFQNSWENEKKEQDLNTSNVIQLSGNSSEVYMSSDEAFQNGIIIPYRLNKWPF
ncbi:hypothetical protein [Enterococcus sp. CWB-B31]|uniref:hypothetical protein n=1 Tax=Enterococcus sp. CWB-B31 TaxID=2885159 RepID=UPI001E42B06A|nr:hypothetical protein [Enterococcus sp. CWB-B31]MCB5954599.1 hypothetical protein [Enterococcus sp. CWB-B31]